MELVRNGSTIIIPYGGGEIKGYRKAQDDTEQL